MNRKIKDRLKMIGLVCLVVIFAIGLGFLFSLTNLPSEGIEFLPVLFFIMLPIVLVFSVFLAKLAERIA